MNYKIYLFLFGIVIFLFTCQTSKKPDDKKNKYDQYDDQYSNFIYTNKTLRLTVEFDGDWIIIPKYDSFNSFQKMYSKYFYSDYSEVLFIGFNDNKKIGARCTCEALGLKDDEYYQNLNFLFKELKDYQITILEDKEIALTNIKGIHLVFETKLNDNNIFIFDSIIFSDRNYNFKFDMWTEKTQYENQKDYILSIFKKIDFIAQNLETKDNTTDVNNIEK